MKQSKDFGNAPVQPIVFADTRQDEDEDIAVDLRALASKLWRGKWIIVICILFAGAFGYLTSTQYDPVYRASAKVMFDAEGDDIIDVGEVVGSLVPTEGNLQNQIEVLRSTNLIGKVVDAKGLDRNPELNPRLAPPPEPTLVSRLRDAIVIPDYFRQLGRDFGLIEPPPPPAPPPDPDVVAEAERRLVIQNILSRLSLVPVPSSRVIEIGFVSGNPQTAALVANAVADQYIVDQLEARLEATRAATDWLSGRVEDLRLRLQAAEEAVEAARAEQSAEAGQSLDITRRQLEALSATLTTARNAARNTGATYERLSDALASGDDFGTVPDFRSSPVLSAYLAREGELKVEQATLRRQLNEGHPDLVRVTADLEILRNQMAGEAARIVESARAEWRARQDEVVEIEREIREVEDLALEQSRDAVTVRQLEREAAAARLLYENFLTRLNETSEQERLTTADARILTAAEPPLIPLRQAQNRTLSIALVIGAIAGVGLVFLLDKLNNTFRSVPQLEDLTGETVLGSIPTLGSRMRRTTVLERFRDKPKSSLAEAVRNLRTSILFSNVDHPPQVVMFTSSVPREGKSTTATLMALTSHQMGRSAVIVDCDLRLPALAELIGGDDGAPGLLSALQNAASLDECIFRDRETGLHVLMTKPSEPRSSVNAADILSSRRFPELIAELKTRYDLVILDTPPTLAVADPRILSALSDAVVYVVRWDHTPRGAVLEGLKGLRTIKAPLAGVVLTLVNEKKAARYAYEGYDYYRGRYRDYYVE